MLRSVIWPLTILACAVFLSVAAARGAEKYRPTPFGPTAADKIADRARATQKVQDSLTVGDKYTLKVTRGGVVQSYDGKLLKTSDHWIVLRDYSTVVSSPVTAQMGKLPLIGDWARRSGEKPGQVDRWIPREAVSVVSHRKAQNAVTIRTPLGNEPPVDQGGRIELVRDGKVVSPANLELAPARDGNLTVLNHDSASRRELLDRREVLSISYYGRCLDPNEKE
jgi:hypothetical protein